MKLLAQHGFADGEKTKDGLSQGFLDGIIFSAKDIAIQKLKACILNGLPTDSLYAPAVGSEPKRNKEVLQSWDSLRNLLTKISGGSVQRSIGQCETLVNNAIQLYAKAESALPTPWENRSDSEHLEDLQNGIRSFRKLAEL